MIKRRNSDTDLYYLFVAIYSTDDTQLIATGKSFTKSHWDERRGEPKGEYLADATRIKSEVMKVIARMEALDLDVTPHTVKLEYSRAQNDRLSEVRERDRERRKSKKAISTVANQWISDHLFGYKKSTRKTITESINQFLAFLNDEGLAGIERGDLTQEVITDYERYLQEVKGLSNSTHGKRMKHLRKFLRFIRFDTSAIKLRTFKREIVSLTLDELAALEGVETTIDEEQRAKDMFLLGCYTGQRISDLRKITPESIRGGELFIRQQKTGKEVSFPILPEVEAILKRHNGGAPRIIEQHLNRSIKEVARNAGISGAIHWTTNQRGHDVKKKVAKHLLITSHVAGKTFISTTAPERYKLTPAETAAVCGKNLKTLLSHYYNLPQQEAKTKMIEVARLAQMQVAK